MQNRKFLTTVFVATILFGSFSTSQAGLNINLNVGTPPPVVVPTPPAPVYVAPPPPVTQVALPAAPPQFIYVPELGYYVAVGIPYDIAYIGQSYYMFSNGRWYCTAYYGGPLVIVGKRLLPPLLARHSLVAFRHFREAEFRRYSHDPAHYHGQLHNPAVRAASRREEHHEIRHDIQHDESRH